MAQQTLVLRLSPAEQEALRARLAGGTFEHRAVPTRVQREGRGVVATLYTSGKLVVQGAAPELFVARFAEAPRRRAARLEGRARATAFDRPTVGSDESSRATTSARWSSRRCGSSPRRPPSCSPRA
ncbi:MAG: DUF3378 domain-containing protein [Planctomycetes bacterium]|nr:DUF3378 domain-containing protein [Planctomycetota bacterium]